MTPPPPPWPVTPISAAAPAISNGTNTDSTAGAATGAVNGVTNGAADRSHASEQARIQELHQKLAEEKIRLEAVQMQLRVQMPPPTTPRQTPTSTQGEGKGGVAAVGRTGGGERRAEGGGRGEAAESAELLTRLIKLEAEVEEARALEAQVAQAEESLQLRLQEAEVGHLEADVAELRHRKQQQRRQEQEHVMEEQEHRQRLRQQREREQGRERAQEPRVVIREGRGTRLVQTEVASRQSQGGREGGHGGSFEWEPSCAN